MIWDIDISSEYCSFCTPFRWHLSHGHTGQTGHGCRFDTAPWTCLVVWLPFFIFPSILGFSSSQLTNSIIFQRGGPTTNQELSPRCKWLWMEDSNSKSHWFINHFLPKLPQVGGRRKPFSDRPKCLICYQAIYPISSRNNILFVAYSLYL